MPIFSPVHFSAVQKTWRAYNSCSEVNKMKLKSDRGSVSSLSGQDVILHPICTRKVLLLYVYIYIFCYLTLGSFEWQMLVFLQTVEAQIWLTSYESKTRLTMSAASAISHSLAGQCQKTFGFLNWLHFNNSALTGERTMNGGLWSCARTLKGQI